MFDFDLQVRFWRGVTDAMLHNTDAAIAAASEWQDKVLAAGHEATNAAKPGARHTLPQTSAPVFGFAGLPSPATTSKAAPNPFASLWWLAPWQQSAGQMWGQSSNIQSRAAAPNPLATNPFAMNPFALNPFLTAFMSNPFMGAAAKPAPSANPFFDMNPFVSQWFETYWSNAASVWTGQPKKPTLWGFGLQPATEHPFAAFWPFPVSPWGYMQTPLTAAMMSAGMPFKVASPSAKASTAAMDAAHAAQQQMEKVYSAYRSDGGHAAAQIMTLPWTLAASLLAPDATPAKPVPAKA
ncbi:MAG: hypothetical protein ABL893_13155 [Hyphomicrobium sp.]